MSFMPQLNFFQGHVDYVKLFSVNIINNSKTWKHTMIDCNIIYYGLWYQGGSMSLVKETFERSEMKD